MPEKRTWRVATSRRQDGLCQTINNITSNLTMDSDSDGEDLLSPALPVMQVGDLSQPPRDGLEYVWKVVMERKNCPKIVTAPLEKNFQTKQNVFVKEPTKTDSAPEPLLPTKEWQTYQEADFSELRLKVSNMYSKRDVWHSDLKLPPIRENVSDWNAFLSNNEPVLSILFPMTQPTLEFLLEVLIENLNTVPPGEGILHQHGKWIFAILATLKLPLEPNMCSTLRDLARICSQIRSRLCLDDENVATVATSLNLFICIVARYFRQGDLAD